MLNLVTVARPGKWTLTGLNDLFPKLRERRADLGTACPAAVNGQNRASLLGPITIDARARDIVQNIFMPRAECVNAELNNKESRKIPAVRDPARQLDLRAGPRDDGPHDLAQSGVERGGGRAVGRRGRGRARCEDARCNRAA